MWGREPGGSAAQRADELEAERRKWETGRDGEQAVAGELAKLPTNEWWVFNDLPIGSKGTNIDHLVIGVGGVFTLNTKNVSGHVWVAERTLMIDGELTAYLPSAVHEGRSVAQRLTGAGLPIDVVPMLVFVRGHLTIKAMPSDVAVVQLATLRESLLRQPRVLTPDQAYQVVVFADRPATWQ